MLNADLVKLVEDFAAYQHSDWVFSMQGGGWTYHPTLDSNKRCNPLIRPYQALPKEVQAHIKSIRISSWVSIFYMIVSLSLSK